jgi:hypothetical protein
MINFYNALLTSKVYDNIYKVLFYRMKHSNITYDLITKVSLIDKSLKRDLEIAKERKLRIKKMKENQKEKSFEMSESHCTKPYIKNRESS